MIPAAPRVIVDDALYRKQEAVAASLRAARRNQWVVRIAIRVCFLLASRAIAYVEPAFAALPGDWPAVAKILLVTVQALCVLFGFWSWTDRIFAPVLYSNARQVYRARLRKLGYETGRPEFIVDIRRLQMRLDEAHPPVTAQAVPAAAGPASGPRSGS